MSTLTVRSSANDGYLRNTSTVYSVALAGAGTYVLDDTSADANAGQDHTPFPNYHVYLFYLSFDTSAIPDAATITAVSLNLHTDVPVVSSGSNTLNAYAIPTWDGVLSNSDWIDPRNLAGSYTKVASFTPVTSALGIHSLMTFTENGTNFRTAINKTGPTQLLIVISSAESATASASGESQVVQFYTSEQSGTTNDPSITVTYDVSSSATGQLTLPAITLSATGLSQPIATGALALRAPTLAASGLQAAPSTATGAETLPRLRLAASGQHIYGTDSAGVLTLPRLTVAVAGYSDAVSATGAFTLPALTVQSFGTMPMATVAFQQPRGLARRSYSLGRGFSRFPRP